VKLITPIITIAMMSLAFSVMAQSNSEVDLPIVKRADNLLLADPQTIIDLRHKIIQNSAARQAPIIDDFSEVGNREMLDLEDIFEITLEPDSVAPRVSIARYQSTAVSFVDAYGNPWPIRRISNFLEGLIAIDKATGDEDVKKDDPQAGSFTMTALRHGVVGNITVYLEGLSTPISLMLEGNSGVFHRIATMRVNEAGPQTNVASMLNDSAVTIGTASDVDLNNALYGVSPAGSETMLVSGAEGKAWIKDDHLYLQTPLAVFSPQILGVSHGNGRYRAYKLPLSSTVMGTNNNGQTVSMRIGRAVSAEASNSLGVR